MSMADYLLRGLTINGTTVNLARRMQGPPKSALPAKAAETRDRVTRWTALELDQ